MSEFVKHTSCDDCGSSDALAVYTDGHTYCFSCTAVHLGSRQEPEDSKALDKALRMLPLSTDFVPLSDRKIKAETARKFGVGFQPNGKVQHVYPYFDKAGRHISNKLRLQGPEKKFVWEGLSDQATLFGQQLFPPDPRGTVTLVEGECDALACYEMQGSRYPVVSVHGAGTARSDCTQNYEYLNGFQQIVVCFDKDEPKFNPKTGTTHYPGQEAALAVAALFPLGKVRILTLSEGKDANEYLAAGKTREFINEWWRAPSYTPTGLKLGKDMWEEVSAVKTYETVLYPWESLNKKTYGMRLSEVVLLTGDTGDGKTSIVKEWVYHVLKNTSAGVGLLFLEEPNRDTLLGLMSIAANKPLHLPDVREGVSNDELRGYFDSTVATERVVVWDHFGSNSIHEVLAKISHMHALGCKYIFLDHLSIIVSDQSGDERKQLDEISTKIKTLCMELNIAVVAVIHINRQGQVRSSAGPEQLSNIVMQIYRLKDDLDEWRRNVTKIVVKKNRFCGRTGPATYLFYDPMTGRLNELKQEEIDWYEAGNPTGGKW